MFANDALDVVGNKLVIVPLLACRYWLQKQGEFGRRRHIVDDGIVVNIRLAIVDHTGSCTNHALSNLGFDILVVGVE
jgi:hypothetical protein